MTELTGKDRLIFALDVPSNVEAMRLVNDLDGVVSFFKIGWELFLSGGLAELLHELKREKQVFVDLKLPSDINETIGRVIKLGVDFGIEFFTLSFSTDIKAIAAARDARGDAKKPKLLTVPLASHMGPQEFAEQYGAHPSTMNSVLQTRARQMMDSGCDGLVVSGSTIKLFREMYPPNEAILVSPAIRPEGSSPDDHKRFCTPSEAIAMGADFLVVGRPIRDAPNRRKAAEEIITEIDSALERRANCAERRGGATDPLFIEQPTSPVAVA